MSHRQELIENGYTQVITLGNPKLPDELDVVARGQAALILASEEDVVKTSGFVDGVQHGGRIIYLDDPAGDVLSALKQVSRDDN